MGQQYSFVVKVLHDHALVLKDLAVLNHEGLASKWACSFESTVKLELFYTSSMFDCDFMFIKRVSAEFFPGVILF